MELKHKIEMLTLLSSEKAALPIALAAEVGRGHFCISCFSGCYTVNWFLFISIILKFAKKKRGRRDSAFLFLKLHLQKASILGV
ncbi:hypothetical protein N473_12230 [Pseudoalteromonas luteoviolacea CPMOR-1]|uniref:Uncharacterized protein n=1 Tax=Pseudoalteromonas luteoviolacea CPMOR-1 TaxID=1365248 RepID=A0A167M4D2_9GAMM|nr:hypothetical protein N473_12230 [Pseudoalteromonas luteoviolacea CPMOR-1]